MIGLALDAISATAAIQSDGGDFIFGPNTPMPDGGYREWLSAVPNLLASLPAADASMPVAVALLPGREMEMCLILGLSASCALLLPVSTPPNAVAFSTGLIKTVDLRGPGVFAGLLGPLLAVCWVLLLSLLL